MRKLIAGVTGALLCGASALAGGTPLTTELVIGGLERPVYATHAPGDFDNIYIVLKRGIVLRHDLNTSQTTQVMNIDARVAGGLSNNTEQGLLGLAFDPDFDTNGYFYVNYTRDLAGTALDGDTHISRFSVNPPPGDTIEDTELVLLEIDQDFSNHNGGWLGFSPVDGYLYIAVGDGGSANDPFNRAQTRTNLLGTLLRIDVDGTNGASGNYGIPADNPYAGHPSFSPEIWAFGLRNPFRCSFDRLTGDLYIGDVGQDAREEVNFQFATSPGGENYGWRCREGEIANPSLSCTPVTAATEPVWTYVHSFAPFVCSVTGGYAYRGCAIPDLEGTYFFADYCSEQIWSWKIDASGTGVTDFQERTSELAIPGGPSIDDIVSFGEDAYGEIYIVDQGTGSNGEIFRIIPAAGSPFVDCDSNGVEDACEILDGSADDDNNDGIPDVCQTPVTCLGDADGNGVVDVNDITTIVNALGTAPGVCQGADVDGNGSVDVNDITTVVNNLGQCNASPC